MQINQQMRHFFLPTNYRKFKQMGWYQRQTLFIFVFIGTLYRDGGGVMYNNNTSIHIVNFKLFCSFGLFYGGHCGIV